MNGSVQSTSTQTPQKVTDRQKVMRGNIIAVQVLEDPRIGAGSGAEASVGFGIVTNLQKTFDNNTLQTGKLPTATYIF